MIRKVIYQDQTGAQTKPVLQYWATEEVWLEDGERGKWVKVPEVLEYIERPIDGKYKSLELYLREKGVL